MGCTFGFRRIFSLKVLSLVAIFCALSSCDVIYPKDEEYPPHPSSFRRRVSGEMQPGRRNPQQQKDPQHRSQSSSSGRSVTLANLQPPSVKCSDNYTFCEEVQNYPMDQVKMAVSSNSSALHFLRNNLDTSDSILTRKRPTEVDYKEKRVCDVITRTVFPKAAKTSQNVWKYVVNTDTTYKQGIEIEQCSEENAPCTLCTAEKSRCVQKFIGRKMLVFDENELDSYIDLFNFPAACVCYVNDIF